MVFGKHRIVLITVLIKQPLTVLILTDMHGEILLFLVSFERHFFIA